MYFMHVHVLAYICTSLGRSQSKGSPLPPINTAPASASLTTPSPGVTTPPSPEFQNPAEVGGVKKRTIPSADMSFAQFKKQALENAERVSNKLRNNNKRNTWINFYFR